MADNNHQLANQFGIVRNLGVTKIAKRESFLIDPKGTIVYHYNSVNTQSHAAQVLADIQKLDKTILSQEIPSETSSKLSKIHAQ